MAKRAEKERVIGACPLIVPPYCAPVLIEAAKLASQWNPQLALVHERELTKGNRNRATLAVARKLVTYLLTIDKTATDFVLAGEADAA